jgi:hypothetical protein
MSMWDPFELAGLPLSAYTPGQGDPDVEGGYETISGDPIYTLEQYLDGSAPYVTGATSRKKPSGQLIFRSVGNQNVPVRITDYGPGVKGLDIATSNEKWATDFPYQGSTDKFSMTPPQAAQIKGILAQFAARNYPSNPDGTGVMNFAQQNYAQSGGASQSPIDYAVAMQSPSATDKGFGALGSILGGLGKSMGQQSQQGMQQALALLKQHPSAISSLLDQLTANPTQYLPPIQI